MPKKGKKRAHDMTTEEAIHVLFPKSVVKRIKKAVADTPKRGRKKRKKPTRNKK